MNNERAIELLHRLQDEQFDGPHGDERREALEMAVRALVEPNIGQKTIDCIIERLDDEDRTTGDTIYRQAAIDALNLAYTNIEVVNNRPVNDCEQELYYRIRRELSKLPSAQPQRKKGKWLDGKGNVKIVGYGAYCSCCRRESEYLNNYCGWCGALMNEEEWKEWSE